MMIPAFPTPEGPNTMVAIVNERAARKALCDTTSPIYRRAYATQYRADQAAAPGASRVALAARATDAAVMAYLRAVAA